MTLKSVYGVLMRGGTSRGLFLKKTDVENILDRDEVILKIFGSGTSSQVDGIGGGVTHTSKVMIVGRSRKPDVDVEYEFGQVGVDKRMIDWTGNCGNLTSAVAPFAIDEGLIPVKDGLALIKMLNINTMKRVDAVVPVKDGVTQYDGDYRIDGVPTPGSKIETIWHDPAGSVTGRLLPTGNAREFIDAGFGKLEVSIVDAGNPVVFVRAVDVGFKGTEKPDEVGDEVILRLEKIRGHAAKAMGLVDNPSEAVVKSPHFPFLALVRESHDFRTVDGRLINSKDYDVSVRLFSMQKMHHACAVTAAICIAVASKMAGTLVHEMSRQRGETIIVGHPRGLIDLKVKVSRNGGGVESVTISRTVRKIMAGKVFYPS
jgi:2-methylaconitate cis-trans-isomerase PrpF